MPNPAVSIVIPAFNDEEWIAAALESCLRQSMTEIEVICVDDFSNDNTRDVVRDFSARDLRVRLIELNENASAFQARRIGVEASVAPFVLFLDADDELAPDAVQVALSLARSSEADVVAFGVDFAMPEGQRRPAFASQVQPKQSELRGSTILSTLFPTGKPVHGHVWGYLFDSELIKSAYAGLSDERYLPRANDLPITFLVMAAASKYVSTPELGYRYFFRRGTSGHKVVNVEQFMFYLGAVDSIELIEEKVQARAALPNDDGSVLVAYDSARLFIIGNILKYCLAISDTELQNVCFASLRDRVSDPDIIRAAGNFAPEATKLYMQADLFPATRRANVKSVLITTRQLGIGGIQGVIAEQSRYLLAAGMKVTIAVQRSVDSVYELPAGVEIVYIAGATMAERLDSWLNICRESEADVVLDHYVLYNQHWPFYALAAHAINIPTIGFIQSFALRPISDDKTTTTFLDLHLPILETVVALSVADVAYWKMRGIEQVVYLPHPPSPLLAQMPQTDDPKEAPSGRVKIVWWGRLQQSTKQVRDLVPILAALRDRGVDAELNIIGPDTVEVSNARILADADSRGVADFVTLLGPLNGSALIEELADAHINIFTSVIEGSPLALVEAQALGLPVVMYELPWLANLEGNEGIVAVGQRDVHAVAREIELLVGDPEAYVAASAGSLAAAKRATGFDFKRLYTQLLTGSLPESFSPEPTIDEARLLLDWIVRYAEKNSRNHSQTSNEFDRYRKGHVKLRGETKKLRQQISSLRRDLATARAKFASQKPRILEFRRDAKELRQQISSLRRDLATARAKFASQKERTVELRGQLDSMTSSASRPLLSRVTRKARSMFRPHGAPSRVAGSSVEPATAAPATSTRTPLDNPGAKIVSAPADRVSSGEAQAQTSAKRTSSEPLDVTVVIPVYNAEPWIAQCLSSVLRQTGVTLEVICINDGSTDRSGVILKDFADSDQRVRIVEQPNSGQSVGRNAGVEAAKGRYVIFLDSDDYWVNDSLGVLVRRADESELDVLFLEGVSTRDDGVSDELWARYGNYYPRKGEYGEPREGAQMIVDMRRGGDYRAHVGLYLSRTSFLRRVGARFIPGIVHQDSPYTFGLLMKADRVAHEKIEFYARRLRPGSTITSLNALSSAKGYYLGYISMLRDVSSRRVDPDLAGVLSVIVYELFVSASERFAQLPSSARGELKQLDLSPEGQVAFRLLQKMRGATQQDGIVVGSGQGVAVPVAQASRDSSPSAN